MEIKEKISKDKLTITISADGRNATIHRDNNGKFLFCKYGGLKTMYDFIDWQFLRVIAEKILEHTTP